MTRGPQETKEAEAAAKPEESSEPETAKTEFVKVQASTKERISGVEARNKIREMASERSEKNLFVKYKPIRKGRKELD